MKKLRIALLALAHLAMDLTTVAFVYVLTGVREFGSMPDGAGLSDTSAFAVAACVLAYDLLAFGLQPLIGALIDLKRRSAPLLYASLCGTGAAAVLCVLCDFPQGVHALSVAVLVFFSLCNAVFHVAAGAFVIAESEKKCAPLGVFVSLGAIGVALGRLYAPALLFWAGAALIVFGVAFLCTRTGDAFIAPHFARADALYTRREADLLPLLLLIFAVFVRGMGSGALPAGYMPTQWLVLLAALATAAGKAAGGFLSDALGIKAVAAVCLPASAFLLLFGADVPALYLIGLALFNTSMPVTLWLSFAALPRLRNAAFGVMAAFLMLGSVLAMLFAVPQWLAFALVLLSGGAIVAAACLSKNRTCLREGRGKEVKHA